MKKIMTAVFLSAILSGCSARRVAESTVTEEVEAVMYRTRLHHPGCVSNGFWNSYGHSRKITAYGINKCVWPHRCDGCGATNEIYDARWPQFRREWRAVK